MRRRARAAASLGVVLLAASAIACGDDGSASSDGGPEPVAPGLDLSAEDSPRSPSGRVTIPGFEETAVEVTDAAGDLLEWCLLLARTVQQRAQGLMGVSDLGDYAGMLFQFDADSTGGFWMKDTVLPLSIAYLAADGTMVSTADMEPCVGRGDDCPSYPPDGPYRMTVEVPQGGLEDLGLDGEGARLERTGSCSPA